MKICYFADAGSIHVVRWCRHFSALGHDVHLISFSNAPVEGVTTYFVDSGAISAGGGNWRVLLQFRKVKKILERLRPDIFHAHYATSYGITGALCNYHPYIITCLGTDVLISGQQSRLYKWLLRYAFSKADWINSLAPHMSDAIREIGADMSKVGMVPFGIDTDVFTDRLRNPDPATFVITSNRNHEPVYNLPLLFRAVAKVKPQMPDLQFVVTGDGSLRKELEQLALDLGIADRTVFTGRIPQPEMVKLLNRTQVFVTVSFSDGNSLSLAEAMACGAFCIASDIPANAQWIVNNENGFLVPVDDVEALAEKLLFAYRNYDRIQNKGLTLSRQIIAEKGVWKLNMQKVEEKYKSLIESNDQEHKT